MSAPATVTAVFADLPALLRALTALREAGLTRFRVYSPVSLAEYEDLLPQASPVRWFSWVGGFVGAFLGYWLCIGSSFLYNLIVGGKPVVSWLPFTVIGFEVTILTSALVTILAGVLFARLYPHAPAAPYEPSFSADRFGISVARDGAPTDLAALFQQAGAESIRES